MLQRVIIFVLPFWNGSGIIKKKGGKMERGSEFG